MRLSILRAPDLGGRGLVAGNVVEVAPLEAARLLAAGQAVHTPGAKITVPDGFAGFGSFASLPAATDGIMLAGVTDIGPSGFNLLRSDGTRWRPVNQLLLTSHTAAAGTAVAAGGSDTQIGTEYKLPAGLVQPGDSLRFTALADNVAADTNSHVLSIRQGTTEGFTITGGQRLMRYTQASATLVRHFVDKVGFVASATSVVAPTASSAGSYSATSGSTMITETVNNLDADSWLKIAAQPSAGSDWLVYAVRLWLLPGA